MARFLPRQLERWSQGKLYLTPDSEENVDLSYGAISTDTRTIIPNSVFVALKGDHYDGHNFIEQALARGAKLIVMDEDSPFLPKYKGKCDLLAVSDTRIAYQDFAKSYRRLLKAFVIGVTGSVGKTTTRRMVTTMLQDQIPTEESEANLNNEIGLSYTLLKTSPESLALVAEIAMDRAGEIAKLSKICAPDLSIITHIGFSHAEYLGTINNILKEKTSIEEGMSANGIIFINGDDPLLFDYAVHKKSGLPVWAICSEEQEEKLIACNLPYFCLKSVEVDQKGSRCTVISSMSKDESYQLNLPVFGEHYLLSAAFGLAVAYSMGLDMDKAAMSARKFVNTGNRQHYIKTENFDIFDDSYNAAPESLLSAFEAVEQLSGGKRRVLVLGGMRELGRYSRGIHEQAARSIMDMGYDKVILIGKETLPAKELFVKEADPEVFCGYYECTEDAIPRILSEVKKGDFVLIKGSRYYKLEKVAQALENFNFEG